MNADLDALATALYVTVDDMLIANPDLVPERPEIGIVPLLSDAELVTLSVIQALLGFTSEARFIRHAHLELRHLFPYIPDRAGYNKRLRGAPDMLRGVIRLLATSCTSWTDDIWLFDSTPVECARFRETVKRSNLAGAAGYGYCASHSRYFWGFRLHLIATPSGLPIAFAMSNPKDDERVIARDMLEIDPALLAHRPGQTVIADKGYPVSRIRSNAHRQRRHPDQTIGRKGTGPTRTTLPEAVPPDHRVDQPDPESPTRPRTTRRTNLRRDHRPRPEIVAIRLTSRRPIRSRRTLRNPIDSTCAILWWMTTVGLRELRQDASELVRRVESGEEIQITVAGRLAARMVPAAPRSWQQWDDIADLFVGRPDPHWGPDRDLIDQSVTSPWQRSDEGTS